MKAKLNDLIKSGVVMVSIDNCSNFVEYACANGVEPVAKSVFGENVVLVISRIVLR